MISFFVLFCAFTTAFGFVSQPPALQRLRENPLFPNGRIVGGVDTDIREIPYQVSLEYHGSHFCGGTLISDSHVLTAAHCLVAPDITVRLGTSMREQQGTLIPLAAKYRHPNYNPQTFNNDVAVLQLAKKAPLSDSVKTLPVSDTEAQVGSSFKVSGWGLLTENGVLAERLQSVQIPIISRNSCQAAYSSFKLKITPDMVCAYQLNKDSCQGDSGGPAVVNGKIAGIVSWGVGCARPGFPGVYTNVAYPDIRAFIRHYAKV